MQVGSSKSQSASNVRRGKQEKDVIDQTMSEIWIDYSDVELIQITSK